MEYLGAWRFVLSVSVAAFHIWTPVFPDSGRHAVMGFFAISGFLITKIANETYRDRPIAFLANRALRIYPTYLACLLLTIVAASIFKDTVANVEWLGIPRPQTMPQWISNLIVFDVTPDVSAEGHRFIAQSWSLAIELQLYLVLGLATYRSVKLTLLFFVITLAWALFAIFNVTQIGFYKSALGTSFVFFAGSLAYFVAQKHEFPRVSVLAAAAVYCISMYALPHTMTVADYAGPYPHLFLLISVCCVFVALVGLKSLPRPTRQFAALSKYLGNLSYPVFLLHLTTALPIAALVGPNRPAALFGALVIGTAISAALIRAEIIIDHLRDRIRERN